MKTEKYITWNDDTRWTCTGSFWKLRTRPRLEWITLKVDFMGLDEIDTEKSAVVTDLEQRRKCRGAKS